MPINLDHAATTRPEVLEKALRVYCGKAIVNSVNGDEETLDAILPLVKKYGAAVVVLASERFLKERGIKEKPILKGYGHRVAPMLFDKKMQEQQSSRYILPWTRQAVLDAYQRSGLSVEEIDVFETHDCFTSSEYAAISAFGLTEPGREYEAVESGMIALGGTKPINPSGGLIGCGHPVGASGVRMLLDLYKQVMGIAGRYQVKGVENAMMLNIGGSATTNYTFIVGRIETGEDVI